jgi:hypothetical protein
MAVEAAAPREAGVALRAEALAAAVRVAQEAALPSAGPVVVQAGACPSAAVQAVAFPSAAVQAVAFPSAVAPSAGECRLAGVAG